MSENERELGKQALLFGPNEFVAPDSIPGEPETKPIHSPVWTDNKAWLIMHYLHYFVLLTKHGTYNPARLVRLHREENSRVRFITYTEEAANRRAALARIPIRFKLVAAAQCGEQTTIPLIDEREVRFYRFFDLLCGSKCSSHSIDCRGGRITFPLGGGTLE